MPAEIEARFAAADDAPLDRLARADQLGPARLGPMRAADEIDRYLDTPDGRLAVAGWACRLRSRGEGWRVSLKGPPARAGAWRAAWLHERPEIEGPATAELDPRRWPPSDARTRLAELARGEGQMVERLRLIQHRRERAVTIDGATGGTLSLDAVRIVHDGAEIGRLRVVELELPGGVDRDALEPLAAALGKIAGLAPEPRSKLERAADLLAELEA
jgi:inorganic triphosphatase YgiF